MFSEKYISDNQLIKPDEQLLTSLIVRMKAYDNTQEPNMDTVTDDFHSNKNRNSRKLLIQYGSLVACFLLLIISIATFGNLTSSNKEAASDASQEMFAAESSEYDSQDITMPEYSTTTTDDTANSEERIASSNESTLMEEDTVSIEQKINPSDSFVNGTINILSETVESILITSSAEVNTPDKTITDKVLISNIISCFNALSLTPSIDTMESNTVQTSIISIQYNDGSREDIIHIDHQFLKVNNSEWYTMNEEQSKQLVSYFIN